MGVPLTVANVTQIHVALTLESIDELYLNVIQQRLQLKKGITWFFCQHWQEAYATAMVMSAMTVASLMKWYASMPPVVANCCSDTAESVGLQDVRILPSLFGPKHCERFEKKKVAQSTEHVHMGEIVIDCRPKDRVLYSVYYLRCAVKGRLMIPRWIQSSHILRRISPRPKCRLL